jgi:hypothetical protein
VAKNVLSSLSTGTDTGRISGTGHKGLIEGMFRTFNAGKRGVTNFSCAPLEDSDIEKIERAFAPKKGLYVLSPFDALTLAQGGPGVSTL